jgi:hypothetical protein
MKTANDLSDLVSATNHYNVCVSQFQDTQNLLLSAERALAQAQERHGVSTKALDDSKKRISRIAKNGSFE